MSNPYFHLTRELNAEGAIAVLAQRAFQAARIGELGLAEAHEKICELAERCLPENPLAGERQGDGAAE
jgi:hypothetical protein